MKKLLMILVLLVGFAEIPININAQVQQHGMLYGFAQNGLLIDLVSLWELNGNTTTAFDAHSSNDATRYNGVLTEQTTVSNLTYSNGFDGTDDYIGNIGDIVSYPYWVSGWMYFEGSVGGDVLFSRNNSSATNAQDAVGTVTAANIIEVKTRNGGTFSGAQYSFSTTETWVHIVGVFESANSRMLYINGSLVNSSSSSVSEPSTNNIEIGRLGDSTPSSYHEGKIDQPGLWDGVPSTAEVVALYNLDNGLPYTAFTARMKRLYRRFLPLNYNQNIEIPLRIAS